MQILCLMPAKKNISRCESDAIYLCSAVDWWIERDRAVGKASVSCGRISVHLVNCPCCD